MQDLFSSQEAALSPLADRMRPRTLDEFIGQAHIVGQGRLLRRAIEDARVQGRRGLVLTCKDHLVPYYAKFGFQDEGVTDKSTHGNVAWHQMRLSF